MDFLRTKVFGDFTVMQIAAIAIGLVVIYSLLKFLRGIFAAQTPNPHQVRMKCLECGWVGVTSKHIPVCRKCNSKSLMPV